MKLFTKDIDRRLFAQYSKGANLDNQYAVAKIFNPYGRGRWYLLNSDPDDPDYLWAIVQMGNIVEMGSVSRRELDGLRVSQFKLPLERDLHFRPVRASELYVGLTNGRFYKRGGWVDVNVTNDMRGEDNDDYGTFEIFKRGGRVEVKILNRDEAFTRGKYNWLLGDFDNDGLANVDDKKPLDDTITDRIDSPSISKSINTILDLKNTMDDNMYSFVDELKGVSPNGSKIYARTKTPYSIIDKLIKKRLLNPKTGLTDLIGTTIVTNDKRELDEVKNVVASGKLGRVIELEDMYENPKQGYRAYHFLIEKNGMPIELQLKTKRQKALNELSHEPYKLGKLDAAKLIHMTEVANEADNGNAAAVKEYDKFMRQEDLENAFYKYREGGYMEGGGQSGVDKHRVYFSTFIEVMDAIHDIAADNGYKVVEIFPDLSYGGVSYGQTKRAKAELEWDGNTKNGKSKKREKNTLNIQIYRMDSGNYELNTYFSYAEGGYMANGGGVGEPYDSMTKYQVEKEYKKLNEKRDLLKNKYGSFKSEELIENEKEIDKIITLLYGKDFSGVGQKFKYGKGGKVGFSDKVSAIKKSLLKRKKVSPKVQKDYGKTYSPKEAEDSAKRIVGAMTASERLKTMMKTRKK